MGTNPDEAAGLYNVIVIDDDPVMRLVIGMIFEDDPRFRICGQAGSAERALLLAQDERRDVDLIILDDELEGQISGVELAPSLRQRWPRASLVMFTADPEGVAASPTVTATVAKTAPEALLETARKIVDVRPPQRRAVASGLEGSRPTYAPLFLHPSTAGHPADTRHRRRLALNGAARWVAAAAVIVALLAASRVPAPRRIVTDLAGFVADLVPGVALDRDSDDADPQPGNRRGQRVEDQAPAAADAGADHDNVPPATAEGPGGRSGEEHPADNGAGAGRQEVPALNDRPVRRPAGPPPATKTPPATAARPHASSDGIPGVGGPPAAKPIPANPDGPARRGHERPAEVTTTTEPEKAERAR